VLLRREPSHGRSPDQDRLRARIRRLTLRAPRPAAFPTHSSEPLRQRQPMGRLHLCNTRICLRHGHPELRRRDVHGRFLECLGLLHAVRPDRLRLDPRGNTGRLGPNTRRLIESRLFDCGERHRNKHWHLNARARSGSRGHHYSSGRWLSEVQFGERKLTIPVRSGTTIAESHFWKLEAHPEAGGTVVGTVSATLPAAFGGIRGTLTFESSAADGVTNMSLKLNG